MTDSIRAARYFYRSRRLRGHSRRDSFAYAVHGLVKVWCWNRIDRLEQRLE